MSWDEDEGQETSEDCPQDCPQDWDLIEELEEAFAACNGWSTKDE